MASFHFASLIHLPPAEVRQPQLWDRIRKWVALTETLFTPDQLAQYGLQDATAEARSLVGLQPMAPSLDCECQRSCADCHLRGPPAS